MTFATTISLASALLCIAVLVQSIRLMRALAAIKAGGMAQMVTALDAATAEARRVLARLTDLLRTDLAGTAQTLEAGKAMIDELAVMTGIANAIAERMLEAVAPGPAVEAEPAPAARSPRRRKAAAAVPAMAIVEPCGTDGEPSPAADMPPGSRVAAARTAQRLRARLKTGVPA